MKEDETNISCKLTTRELQKRKRTVIAKMKALILEREETEIGVRYKFDGSDSTIDLLTTFIKTERLCCGFFTFRLIVGHDSVLLDLTGPKRAKEFITNEIQL